MDTKTNAGRAKTQVLREYSRSLSTWLRPRQSLQTVGGRIFRPGYLWWHRFGSEVRGLLTAVKPPQQRVKATGLMAATVKFGDLRPLLGG